MTPVIKPNKTVLTPDNLLHMAYNGRLDLSSVRLKYWALIGSDLFKFLYFRVKRFCSILPDFKPRWPKTVPITPPVRSTKLANATV